VVVPGFASIALETLEEIDIENRDGSCARRTEIQYVPALNARREHAASSRISSPGIARMDTRGARPAGPAGAARGASA